MAGHVLVLVGLYALVPGDRRREGQFALVGHLDRHLVDHRLEVRFSLVGHLDRHRVGHFSLVDRLVHRLAGLHLGGRHALVDRHREDHLSWVGHQG